MCGRYVLYAEGNEELREILDRTEGEFKTGEIFPTDKAPILIKQDNGMRPVAVSWGFPKYQSKGVVINARAETVPVKPMFRKSFETKRCIIPSSGYFEWGYDVKKTKYQFNMPEAGVLYMAGLYQIFNGEARFIIITRGVNNKDIEKIHPRMPVVLDKAEKDRWMESPQQAAQVLTAAPPLLDWKAV